MSYTITHFWNEVNLNVYAIIRREIDGYYMNNNTGSFEEVIGTNIPSNFCIPMAQDPIIKGRYELKESRTIWNEGHYLAGIWKQIDQTSNLENDIIIGTWDGDIVSTGTEIVLANQASITNMLVTITNNTDPIGTNLATINISDSTSFIPLSNVKVVVRNPGDTFNTRSLITDIYGNATTFLDDGIYPLRLIKEGVTFPTNILLTVSGDTVLNISGSTTWKQITVVPGLQTIYGRMITADGTPEPGQQATFSVKKPKTVDSNMISKCILTSITDSTGDFELRVLKGATGQLSVTNYYSKEVTITQDDTREITLYLVSSP